MINPAHKARLRKAVHRIESQASSLVSRRVGNGAKPVMGGVRWAKAPATGIPACVGATPGSATCTLYQWNGTAFALGSDTKTIKNPYGSAVASNALVGFSAWQGADWVVTEACAASAGGSSAALLAMAMPKRRAASESEQSDDARRHHASQARNDASRVLSGSPPPPPP